MNILSIVPMSLAYATMTPTIQTIIVPISTSEAFTTFSTTTIGATTTVASLNGSCTFGSSGATTSLCYLNLPHINTTVSSLLLSYVFSTSSVSTSTATTFLNYVNQTDVASTTGTSTPTFTTITSTSSATALKTASTTFTLDLTTLFQNFLNSSSSVFNITPSAVSTSTSYFSLSNPVMTITRSVLIPTIKYASSSNQFSPFDRTSFSSYATTTATSTIDLSNAPTLDLSTQFLSPVGRISSNNTSYTETSIPTNGLTAYYVFDADSNSSTGGYNGTPTNSPTFTTGKLNNSLTQVAASSQYVSLPNAVLPWGTNTLSVNMWVKMSSTGGNQAWLMTARTGQGFMLYKSGTNTIDCAKPNVVSTTYDWTGIDTNWHMWTCVASASGIKLYLDGNPTPVASNTQNSNYINPGDTLEVGAYRSGGSIQSSWYNDGKIDNLGIWSTALSTTTILQIYNGGSGVGYPLSVISGTTTPNQLYGGAPIDTTYSPHPTTPQQVLPAVSYPYLTATTTATSTINTLTIATTTQYTVYSPFANYVDASSTVTTYLTLNGTLVGAYTYQKGNEASTGKLTFVHTNYLGTPVLETDDKGDIVQMDITDPFGNYVQRDQRKDNAFHNKAYTSHEFDDVTGLTYAHARYLDTKMHSFMSVDPLLYSLPQSYLIDPQQMNSYGYARNNPVVYRDPDGKAIDEAGNKVNTYIPGLPGVSIEELNPISVGATILGMGSEGIGAGILGVRSVIPKISNYFNGLRQSAQSPGLQRQNQILAKIGEDVNPRVKNVVTSLFKPTDELPGGTFGAIKNEIQTGQATKNVTHSLNKAPQEVRTINNILKDYNKGTEVLKPIEVKILNDFKGSLNKLVKIWNNLKK